MLSLFHIAGKVALKERSSSTTLDTTAIKAFQVNVRYSAFVCVLQIATR